MRTRTKTLLVVAALLSAGAAPVRPQDVAGDSRWLAYLGCWEPIESVKSVLCVVPVAGASAVDFVTITKGLVTARERIATTGERVETNSGDCAGWRSAEWSAHGQRLFLRSEDLCAGASARGRTGLIAMSATGQWLYIQSATVAGQTGLRVERYRGVTGEVALPSDVTDALRLGVSATSAARAAAAAALSIDDIVEASERVEAAVLEAWLVERGEPFALDAKRLVTLADAGVPARVIDLMIALSYPKVFAINAASRLGERRVRPDSLRRGAGVAAFMPISPLCSPAYLAYPYAPLYSYAPFDCTGLGYGYGYGYGSGWYPGGYPVTVVHTGPARPTRPHGRAENGRGYRQSGNEGADAKPRSIEPLPTSTGSSHGVPSSGSGSSSTSGSGEQRTAKPRPQ